MPAADLLVALWGLDFKPDTHAEILRKAEEENFYPTVDVFLPVCKEPLVLLANTWRYVAALDYPRVTVHVLDDGHQDDVRDLAAQFGFECASSVHRGQTAFGRSLKLTRSLWAFVEL